MGEGGALGGWGRTCHSKRGSTSPAAGREGTTQAPAPRSQKCKIWPHGSPYTGASPSTRPALRGNKPHVDREGLRGHSVCPLWSIILPGIGSCWTWSGMVQTTFAVGHPGKDRTLATCFRSRHTYLCTSPSWLLTQSRLILCRSKEHSHFIHWKVTSQFFEELATRALGRPRPLTAGKGSDSVLGAVQPLVSQMIQAHINLCLLPCQ